MQAEEFHHRAIPVVSLRSLCLRAARDENFGVRHNPTASRNFLMQAMPRRSKQNTDPSGLSAIQASLTKPLRIAV